MRSDVEAVRAALDITTYPAGYCQRFVRECFDAPAAGDVDGDGDSDAADGWALEPASARSKNRAGRYGAAGYFSGGTHGYGHRVVMLGGGKCRSTDMSPAGRYAPGTVSTVTVDQVEAALGVKWVGDSTTCDGVPIPAAAKANPDKRTRVSQARELLQASLARAKKRGNAERVAALKKALDALPEA